MEQYIPKSALVAELKKRFDYRVKGLKAINDGTYWKEGQSENELNSVLTRCAYNAAKNEVFELMCFLDTFEVKEVDLEKEIKEEYLKRRCYRGRDNMLVILNEPQFNEIAKHFFELGMQVSNKAQKGE